MTSPHPSQVSLSELLDVMVNKVRSPSWDAVVGFVLKKALDTDMDGVASVQEQKVRC